MSTKTYDLIVIGSGPGGEGAAMKAAKEGKSVLLVERYTMVGGGCTHWGTIPSKALRSAVRQVMDISQSPLFRDLIKPVALTFPQLLRNASTVIAKQVALRESFYLRNNVTLVQGQARLLDAHTVNVDMPRNLSETYRAQAVVIATGSRPYHPPEVDFHHPRIFDSDTILGLMNTPRTITIYGAGVVGCEYACIFRNMNVKVNLVNTRAKLLEFLDDEIIDALSYHLREQGTLIRHSEQCQKVEGQDDGVVLHLDSGKKLKTDILLWANGRTGNSDGLGLEALGIQPDQRGQIPVNENYQTAVSSIYAVGDVVGWPSLASAAYDQGRFAATHWIHGHCEHLVQYIPTGIYTTPEISCVGRTERDLTQDKIPYEVGHAFFKSLARAQITGHTVGMLKILFHRQSLEILGIHCFGDQASEIIHIGQAVMSQKSGGNTLMYFVNTTFNYPTMAEAYRVAALNGLNRVF